MLSQRTVRVAVFNVILVLWVSVLACNAAVVNEQQLVISKFPRYHILNNAELDKATLQHYQAYYDGNQVGVVKTDIDGNGFQDIAVLLKGSEPSSTKFVILLCNASSVCSVAYELDTAPHQQIYVTRVKQGTLVSRAEAIANGENQSVKLVHDGIRLTYFEKAEIVFFWDNKLQKINSIQTAD